MALIELLRFIKEHPTAYLGRAGCENKYSALVGFISGYVNGVKETMTDRSTDVFPKEFNDFVRAYFNDRHGFLKYGPSDHWFEIILKEAGDQDSAFDLFYESLNRFSNKQV